MEFTAAVAIIVIAVIVVIYFGKSLSSVADVANRGIKTTGNIVDTGLKLTDDTVSTYGFEVRISNAEKRTELAAALDALSQIVTVDDLEVKLAGKVAQPAS